MNPPRPSNILVNREGDTMRPDTARPRIICHMIATVDGKIDGAALEAVADVGEYETVAALLGGDAWLNGRTTMQEHFAAGTFSASSSTPAGPQPVFVARRAESYAVSVDTLGKLRWASGDLDGDHVICAVSERAPAEYLTMLREEGVSYIVSGTSEVDLSAAVDILGEQFGIRTLLLEGGGTINGSFLEAGLIDELSLLIVPGIDGRHDVAAVFDGINPEGHKAVQLELKSVERREAGVLWLRYDVVRS